MSVIFVFGSNLAGRHGAGAALYAKKHFGAIQGKGEGRQGQSFAIPTKDRSIRTLPLKVIQSHVELFKQHAEANQEDTFLVTGIDCGLAGYNNEQIAPMFIGSPANCVFDRQWFDFLGSQHSYFTEGW